MNLNALFNPKSIAVIGASRKVKTVGNDVAKNLVEQNYGGDIYFVNPKADEIYGQKVYNNIADIPGEIDLAVFAIPAKFIPASIEEIAAKGAKSVLIISSGFKEIGNIELEQEVRKVCNKHDIALVGPNCLGVLNPYINMNASFAALMPKKGNVSFVSQSGALVSALLDYAKEIDLGFAKFVSIGNKAGIKELDLIKYFFEDDQTDVICMYSEDLANADEFIKVLKEHNRGANPKPVIFLKSGKTEEGSSAIASHTGSLSSGDAAYQALFAQAGVVRADSVAELFDLAEIFSKNKLQAVENTAIITNAGGPGVLTTDAVIGSGLKLAEFADETSAKLKEALRPSASSKNPVDVLGDAKAFEYQAALEAVAADPNTDSMTVLLTPQTMTEIEETAQAIIEVHKNTDKPMVVCFMGVDTVSPGVKLMREAGIAVTSFPESAAKALATFGQFSVWTKQGDDETFDLSDTDYDKVKAIFDAAKKKGQTSFPEAEAQDIMAAYNFPLLRSAVATSADEAAKIAADFGGKLAMKIVSKEILHKSDVGGVMLNITKDDAKEKYQEMMKVVAGNEPDAKLEGALMMEMAPASGTEVILGVVKAPGLGTMVMAGLGGIFVEVLKDVNFAFAGSITKQDARRMIETLNSAPIFQGVRGQKPRDIEMIVETIGRLAKLVTDFPEIFELDINPLLVLNEGEGVKVLDVRVVLEK